MNIKKLISSIATTAFLGIGFTTVLSMKTISTALAEDFCNQHGFPAFIEAETKNSYIHICAVSGGGLAYFGIPKNQSNGIGPIRGDYARSDNTTGQSQFIFPNGNYSYIVTSRSLTVTKNRRVILQERILFFDEVNSEVP